MANKIAIGVNYDDYTSRTYNFDVTEFPQIASVKSAIAAINTNMPEYVKQTFISNDRAPLARIKSATFISSSEEVVYGHGY